MFISLFFFLKITLVVQGLLWFCINFRIFFNISVKNGIEILIDVALNQHLWGAMDILTISILPSVVWNVSMYLSLLQFLSSVSRGFQCTDYSSLWLNLYLGILFFSDAIVNVIVYYKVSF